MDSNSLITLFIFWINKEGIEKILDLRFGVERNAILFAKVTFTIIFI